MTCHVCRMHVMIPSSFVFVVSSFVVHLAFQNISRNAVMDTTSVVITNNTTVQDVVLFIFEKFERENVILVDAFNIQYPSDTPLALQRVTSQSVIHVQAKAPPAR